MFSVEELLVVLKKLESNEIEVINWGISPSNLEEVFISTTGLDYKDAEKINDMAKYLNGEYMRDDNNDDNIEVIEMEELDENGNAINRKTKKVKQIVQESSSSETTESESSDSEEEKKMQK